METQLIRLVTVEVGGREKFKAFHLQDFKRPPAPKAVFQEKMSK